MKFCNCGLLVALGLALSLLDNNFVSAWSIVHSHNHVLKHHHSRHHYYRNNNQDVMKRLAMPVAATDVASTEIVMERQSVSWMDGKMAPTSVFSSSSMWLSAAGVPSEENIQLLQRAMNAVYQERDGVKADDLLTQTIEVWEERKQPADEVSALYRVRAAVRMDFTNQPQKALNDYNIALDLLEKNPAAKKAADPSELPAIRLGRARAIRSSYLSNDNNNDDKSLYGQAVEDYKQAFLLTARYEDDYYESDEERMMDGAAKNPFAVWEYGMALRGVGNYNEAYKIHLAASDFFSDIGDTGRSIISLLDAGIDLAANMNNEKAAIDVLQQAIDQTTSIRGNDVGLLQRVIAKEGEARVALASLLWNSNSKSAAEDMLGKSCSRLDQLEADADKRNSKNPLMITTTNTSFSIDDIPSAGKMSCSRMKNEKFVQDTLLWPKSLQEKVNKLYKLKA